MNKPRERERLHKFGWPKQSTSSARGGRGDLNNPFTTRLLKSTRSWGKGDTPYTAWKGRSSLLALEG